MCFHINVEITMITTVTLSMISKQINIGFELILRFQYFHTECKGCFSGSTVRFSRELMGGDISSSAQDDLPDGLINQLRA